ncbi:odorant receptor 22c-like [Odontomachus brunneus]|uniref:odorant receptor 22c-like n=1 Tax=Odontomachus brunneus TaxID=486640 RepID=UPI0013F1BDAC|nr:odorant receptor 22c-like [Odontomachus brunneus]
MLYTSTITPPLKIGLQILGVWPDTPYNTFHRLIYMSIMLAVYYFQQLYIITNWKVSEFEDLVGYLTMVLYYLLTILKLTILWMNRRIIRELLSAIDTDWREGVKIDQHLQLMRAKATNSQFCTIALLGVDLGASIIYFGGENVAAIMHSMDDDNYTSRPFPLKVSLPSGAQQSPLYELLVVFLFIHAMLTVYTVDIITAFISALICHVSGQFDIIYYELRTLSVKISYNESKFTIKMLIEKHNKVIEFANNVEKLYSVIIFMQVFPNTTVMCLMAVVSLYGDDDVGLAQGSIGYITLAAEIFVYCFMGEHLGIKSRSLADAGYDCLWYNMSPSYSRNILLIILRSQKQLTMTAGGVINLSLEAFTSIMKASASYISVLHATI